MDFNNVSSDEFNATVAGLREDVSKVAKSFDRLAVQIRGVLTIQKKQNTLFKDVCERLNVIEAVQQKQTSVLGDVCDRINEMDDEGDEWKED